MEVVLVRRVARDVTSSPGALVRFVQIGRGALALTHRPKLKGLGPLRAAGATDVVTLLTETEGAATIGDAVRASGLQWMWCPFAGAAVPSPDGDHELAAAIDIVAAAILNGGHVVVHCSAGIDRTGMFGYALLRRLGLSSEAAREALASLRQVTAEGVGEDRIAWGDRLASVAGGVGDGNPRP